MLFHGKNGNANARQYYLIRTACLIVSAFKSLPSYLSRTVLNMRWQLKPKTYDHEPSVTDASKPKKEIHEKCSATRWTTRDISNNADSTGAFRATGAATAAVLSCSFSWVLREKTAEKFGYKNFSTFPFLFWAYASMSIYRHTKDCLFIYTRGESMFQTA